MAGFVEREDVLRRGEHVLLMLSGGADSMALLAVLPGVDARLGLQLRLSALHVDYGARGADSDRDREIVAHGCEAAGVPLHVVRLGRRLSGAGFQARARVLRYERAAEIAAARGCDVVATAHNRDDQAETVLYRLTKYASPRGLAGMRPRERRLARPLLCLGAAEIREYCCTRGIEYGEDVTNARPVYARNALRLEVLPALARLNPRVAETLSDTAALAAAEADVLAAATAAAAARAAAQAAAQAAAGGASYGGGSSVPDPGGSGNSAVVAIAQRYLGVPYVYGGASPSGFDCSGLAMYCYAQVGVGLSHGATDQQHASTPVPISALQPGDLVFFGNASYSYHVGIYVGGGSMINAPHTGAVVSYGSIGGAWIGGRF